VKQEFCPAHKLEQLPPPTPEIWQSVGSKWLHTHVRGYFTRFQDSKIFRISGTVTGWLEASRTLADAALWRVLWEDGVEEDLEEHEVAAACASYELEEQAKIAATAKQKQQPAIFLHALLAGENAAFATAASAPPRKKKT
jgi:hypothetical protein